MSFHHMTFFSIPKQQESLLTKSLTVLNEKFATVRGLDDQASIK